jgi:hypothetical protein
MENTVPQSENIDALTGALAKAQAVMKAAPLNKTNPHFKNRYADLASVIDAIRKPLADNGIAVTQTTELRDGAFCLVTRLAHSSGQWLAGEYLLPANVSPQQLGSALTYARRYSLSAIACIAADEDDDAEGARKEGQVAQMPKRENPHVTRAEDISDAKPRYDERGNRVDYIPVDMHRVPKLKVADARPVADTINKAMLSAATAQELVAWADDIAETAAALPDKWIEVLQCKYQEHLDELRSKQKAA